MNAEMRAVMAEIDAAIPKVADWSRDEHMTQIQAFTGSADGWRFVVGTFKVNDSVDGCDGAATNAARGIVYHLTPKQAKAAIDAALTHMLKR